MHKDKGEKLKMGPIWDFNFPLTDENFNDNEKPTGFWIKNSRWIRMMFNDEFFVNKIKERFNYFYQNKGKIISFSNNLSKKLYESRIENNKVWKTLGIYIYPIYAYDFSSFQEEQDYLNRWIEIRFEWLKSEIEKL